MGEERFDEEKFMKALVKLKDTQESIQGFSSWCIKNRKQAYKMAKCWTKVIKKVRIDQKLVLFYLVNDVVQHSSKKGMSELVEKFRNAIKEAIPHLKEDKIATKVQRCLNIWDEREVFDSDFILELNGLIDMTPTKEDSEIIENFQSSDLCKQIKIMKALEDDADYKLKTLKENDLENRDLEAMKAKLKDKSSGNSHVGQFHEGTKRMEAYIKAMEREVTKRKQVIDLLCQGRKYYDSLYGEAEIVATAYANFGSRVKKVESRLKDKIPIFLSTPSAPSPLPSPPDYDAPSPQGEADLKLPEDDEPGIPDYPEPSHTPPGPPPVRSHTPPGRPPTPPVRSYSPPPVPDGRSFTPPPVGGGGAGVGGERNYNPGGDRGYTPPGNRSHTPPGNRSHTPPSNRSYSPTGSRNYASPPPLEPASRLDSPYTSAPSSHHTDGGYHSQETRDLTREAMTIPRDHVSDFLTKIAHGEVLGSQDTLFGSGDHKRRKLSETGSFSSLGNGLSEFISGSGGIGILSAYTQPPTQTETVWSVNQSFQADSDDEGVVENQALQRLRRAANKNQGSSNLISLTGSPAIRDPDENVDGNPISEDMDLSEEEEGQIMDDWAPSGPETGGVLFNHSQPPPALGGVLSPAVITNGGPRGQPPPGLLPPPYLRSVSSDPLHSQPPPNLAAPPPGVTAPPPGVTAPPPGVTGPPPGLDISGPPPVLDIPPPPFRVPPPLDKVPDEVSRSNSWPGGPTPTAGVTAGLDNSSPTTFSSLPPTPFAAAAGGGSLPAMNLPPPPPNQQNDYVAPPLSPTPPEKASPAAVLRNLQEAKPAADVMKLPPQFAAVNELFPVSSSGSNGNNDIYAQDDGNEEGELEEEMEHYNNMRSDIPDTAVPDHWSNFRHRTNSGGGRGRGGGGGADDSFFSPAAASKNARGDFGGQPGRGSFAHERGGRGGGGAFTPDRGHRGNQFRGNGGGFDGSRGRGGGGRGGRGMDWGAGGRGGRGDWRPRRPWRGPPRGGGRW